MKDDGFFQAVLVGVKKASTFTGFCSKHDCMTFAPVETEPFTFAPEQCLLLGYRALCMEVYKKRGTADLPDLMRSLDSGKGVPGQVVPQQWATSFARGIAASLKELSHQKAGFESAMMSKDYSDIAYYGFELGTCPEILCSGVVSPEVDFTGKLIQDLADLGEPARITAFSLFPTDAGGAAVFTWFRSENEAIEEFIQSLQQLADEDLPHAIVRFCFEMMENVFFSPDWWDARSQEERQAISLRAQPTFGDLDLRDDGLRTVDWKIGNRYASFL